MDAAKAANKTPEEAQALFSRFGTRAEAERGIRNMEALAPPTKGQLSTIQSLCMSTGKTPSETQGYLSRATSRAAANDVIDELRSQLPATSRQEDRAAGLAGEKGMPEAGILSGKGPYTRPTRQQVYERLGDLEKAPPARLAKAASAGTSAGAGEMAAPSGVAPPASAAQEVSPGPATAEPGSPVQQAPSVPGALGPGLGAARPSIREIPLSPAVRQELSTLPETLEQPARTFVSSWSATGSAGRQEVAQAVTGAVASLEAAGVSSQQIAQAWHDALGPVQRAMARGMSLQSMAQDAGYYREMPTGWRVPDTAAFLAGRLASSLGLQQFAPPHPPAQRICRPQLSEHDYDVGREMAAALGRSDEKTMTALARAYHDIRNPARGGSWQAGQVFSQTVVQVARSAPKDLGAAVGAKLNELIESGQLSDAARLVWERVRISLKPTRGE